jgi:hypothetical protein
MRGCASIVYLTPPQADGEWCLGALRSHPPRPLAGVIAPDATTARHASNSTVSSVRRLTNALEFPAEKHRTRWAVDEREALDLLTMVSVVHRRLEVAVRVPLGGAR